MVFGNMGDDCSTGVALQNPDKKMVFCKSKSMRRVKITKKDANKT